MRHKNSPAKEILCPSCRWFFLPNSGHQKWCKTCVPGRKWLAIMQRYNLSKPAYDKLLKEQNGHCALCPNPVRDVDHDHETGEVRGLLCNSCNYAMGRLENRKDIKIIEWATRVTEYLER